MENKNKIKSQDNSAPTQKLFLCNQYLNVLYLTKTSMIE
jgi:hypothetical protein